MGRPGQSRGKAAQPRRGMLCIADGNFYSFTLWEKARTNGAELVWRIKQNMRLPCSRRLSDGSYLSRIYRSEKARRNDTDPVQVRVVEYELEGVEDAEPIYRSSLLSWTPTKLLPTNWRRCIASGRR